MSEVLYFILTIGILVFIHEFGHFAAAKLSKMRVDAFAIGFGYRLLGWNKLSGFSFGNLPKDFDGEGNTDYRLCVLPLGGYVKIAGMVDESADTSFAEKEPQPYEFRAKSTSKKVFVITAGVLMNLLLALVIFWVSAYSNGKQYLKTTTIGFVAQNSAAQKAGFNTGDKIIRVNGIAVSNWDDLRNEFFVNTLGKNIDVDIARDGGEKTIHVERKAIPQEEAGQNFFNCAGVRPIIETVLENSAASKAGILKQDVLLAIDETPVYSVEQTIGIISTSKGKELTLHLLRNEKDTIALAATPSAEGKLGMGMSTKFFAEVETKQYTIIESLTESSKALANMTGLTLTMFKRVVSGEVEFKSVFGGPIKIAQYAAKSAGSGISSFIMFLGYLSLSLAIINILPVPALDGGHLMMILVEHVIKREIPIKMKIAIQNTGMVLLLLLMAFILFNDFRSVIKF